MERSDGRYRIGNFVMGDGGLAILAGPCSLESPELGLEVARTMKALCEARGLPYVFKASFDKANRTSLKSWRGPGLLRSEERL